MRRIRDAVVSSWLPEQKTLGRASRKPSECWTRVDIFVCPSNACQYRNTTGTAGKIGFFVNRVRATSQSYGRAHLTLNT